MGRKFNVRVIFFALLLLASCFCLLIVALPFFTVNHDLGVGFLADSGQFLQNNFGFLKSDDDLQFLSLVPVTAYLFLLTMWTLHLHRKVRNYASIFLSIPIFFTLRLLFILEQGIKMPFSLDYINILHDKWIVLLILLLEVTIYSIVTSVLYRLRRKKSMDQDPVKCPKRKKAKKTEKNDEKDNETTVAASEPTEAVSSQILDTAVPVFVRFKEVTSSVEVSTDGQPDQVAEVVDQAPASEKKETIPSSVSIGIYDVVRKEADLTNEQKARNQNSWKSFQPGNLTKKVAEDEQTFKKMMELERQAKEERNRRMAAEAVIAQMEAEKKAAEVEEQKMAEEARQAIAEAFAAAEQETINRAVAEAAHKEVENESAPAAPEALPVAEESRDGWDHNDEEDYDLYSGVGGLGHAEQAASSNQFLLNRQDLMYQFPPKALLKVYARDTSSEHDEATIKRGKTIVDTLSQFKVDCTLVGITRGPTVTMFEIALAPGVKISAVTGLTDNIAMDLAVSQVRLLTPIPGKQAIGVEVPNFRRDTIGFSEIVDSLDTSKMKIPMVLGKKITGENVAMDLAAAPHVLIAGATGSGKSVCVNSMICSILYTKTPKQVRMIMVDPKIVELKIYNGIPHLLTPVITDPKKAIKAMQFCLEEMERRYHVIGSVNVRNISAYNEKIDAEHLAREKMPYIIVIMDEFADLMAVAGKELEMLLHRLSAMARAVGIHLVFATQRPSADVVTGLIKNNLPTKIAFSVTNQINSKIIIDCSGAEKLLGKGDMLYTTSSIRDPERIQGAFLSDSEVEAIADFVKTQGKPDYLDEALFEDNEPVSDDSDDSESALSGDDAIFEKALKIVCDRQSASASYLQRRLCIGYNKAARLVEKMEELGYVGPARGSKPRELLKFPD